MNVLDGLPTLSAGAHKPGSGKACVMEYVSLLAGEKWSDKPACTNDRLADVARAVNDCLLNRDRHLLVPLIVRLFGTNVPVYAVKQFDILTGDLLDSYGLSHPSHLSLLCRTDPIKAVQFLSDLIDIYDRLSGRNETHELSDADMALLNLVSAT